MAVVSFSNGHVIVFTPSAYDFSVLNADNPISKAGNIVVVGNHNYGLTKFRTGSLNKPKNVCTGLAIKVSSRFIGKYNRRFGNQGAGNRYTLLLTAGKLVWHIFQLVVQPEHIHNIVHELLVCRISVQLYGKHDIFVHIQNGDKVVVLKD